MLATFFVFIAIVIAIGACGLMFIVNMYLYRHSAMSRAARRRQRSRSEYHRLHEVIFQS